MGTRLRLFIVVCVCVGGVGWGYFYEALEECLRSPSDQNVCTVLKQEVGRLERADVGHLQIANYARVLVSRPSRNRKEVVSIGS